MNASGLLRYTCLLGLLAGCAVGPDFKRPAAPAATAYTPASNPAASDIPASKAEAQPGSEGASSVAQHLDPKTAVPFDWWTLYQSPALNQLIEQAFQANPDIESATAALKQAQEYARATRGFFYPTITANYSASRNRLAGNQSTAAPGLQGNGDVLQGAAGKSVYYSFHTAQLDVGYQPDLFGMNRRAVEAADAQVSIQQLQLQASYIALASNVVAAALQEALLRAEIDAQEKIVASLQQQHDIMQKQLSAGYASAVDLAMQETALAQAQQSLVPLKTQLEQTRDLLRALTGHYPDQELGQTFTLESLQLPVELPLSLPSQLVEQRPDVRAAEAQLHYATAMAGVAKANTLPQFEITGAIGGMADSPDWMFRSGGRFFDLTANIAQVLFDGGTLRAKSRAAQQAVIQAGADYRSTVIHALQNVADTLYALRGDAENLQAAAVAMHAAERARVIAQKQYAVGYISFPAELLAEQAYQAALINFNQAQASRLGDTAALYVALGGGWWNHSVVQAEKQ